MAVATTKHPWNSGMYVTATGTLNEVMSEVTDALDSSATLENQSFFIAPPFYNGTNITAMWYTTRDS